MSDLAWYLVAAVLALSMLGCLALSITVWYVLDSIAKD